MKLNIYTLLLAPYLILISFNGAFAYSEYLQVFILASFPSIIFFFINLISLNLPKNLFQITDVPIILFSINNIILFIVNPSLTAFKYLIVYVYTFVFVYFSIKYYLSKIGWKSFIQISNIGLYFVIIFIITNLIVFVLTGVNLQALFPRIGPTAESITFYGILMRAYGFSNEPTNLAAYLLSFGLLAIFYNTKYNKKKVIPLIFILLFCFSLTYSTGLFISIFVGFLPVLISFLVDIFYEFKIKKNYIFISILIILLSTQIVIFLPEIFDKILITENFLYSRGDRWLDVWNLIIENRFTSNGLGSAEPSINWYLMLTYENGIIALLLIFTYILLLMNKVRYSNLSKTDKLLFYFGIISLYFQLNSFSTFYFPFYLIFSLVISNIIDSYKIKNSLSKKIE